MTDQTSPMQAHHIIPVEIFKTLGEDIRLLFNFEDFTDFQQMGGNFIYLNKEAPDAQKLKTLLDNDKNIFGDLPVGGADHNGSHPSYSNAVKARIEKIMAFDLGNPDYTAQAQKMMLLDLQRGLKEVLVDGNPDMLNKGSFDLTQMDNALASKGIVSPDNFDINSTQYSKALSALESFNTDLKNPDSYKTKIFNSTDDLAVHNANKMYDNMQKLDELTGFQTDQTRTRFDGIDLNHAPDARAVIFNNTYDVAKFVAATDVAPNLNSASLNSFYDEFKQAVTLSMKENPSSADKAALTALTDKLATRTLDAKAAKLLSDLKDATTEGHPKYGKSIVFDVGDFTGNDLKNSALLDVIDHIGDTKAFENVKINGISVKDYVERGGSFSAKVLAQSEQVSQLAKFEVDAGKGKYEDLFKQVSADTDIQDGIKNGLTKAQQTTLANVLESQVDIMQNTDVDSFKSMGEFQKGSATVEVAGGLLGASLIGIEILMVNAASKKARAEGNDTLADDLWYEFGASTAGAIVAEQAAAGAMRFAVVALGGAVGTVGAPILIASAVVGYFGAEFAKDLYGMTRDKDGDGTRDIWQRMERAFNGEEFKVEEIPNEFASAVKQGIASSLTYQQLVALAKLDGDEGYAYRYALQKLNPFVIKGVNFDNFNTDGELELLSEEHPNGLSDAAIEDRAKLLLLKIKYLEAGLKLTDTLQVDADADIDEWTYTDYSQRPYAGNIDRPLTLSIEKDTWIPETDRLTIFNLHDPEQRNPDYQPAAPEELKGGSKGDHIYGSKLTDKVIAGGGDDHVEGNGGNDEIEGEGGNDTLIGGAGEDTIEGGDNDDVIFGGFYNGFITDEDKERAKTESLDASVIRGDSKDTINGGSGDDIIFGGGGNDTLIGDKGLPGGGNDIIYGDEGADEILGGIGNDKLYAASNEKGEIFLNHANLTKDEAENKLFGGLGNDELYGAAGKDTLVGGKGNDYIMGGEGDDTIHGDEQTAVFDVKPGDSFNDFIHGGSGDDTIDGGEGNDTIIGGEGKLTAKGGTGNDVIYASQDEEIADDLKGGAGNDIIYAGGGTDYVYGDEGNDTLYAGDDDATDNLLGGKGNDVLHGTNTGFDILEGGEGSDLSIGGTQGAIFRDGEGSDRFLGNGQNDNYIIDLSSGTNSILDNDGKGSLIIKGSEEPIAIGEFNTEKRCWMSTDGLYEIRKFTTEDGQHSTVTINKINDPQNTLYIERFINGELGLTFEAEPEWERPTVSKTYTLTNGSNIATVEDSNVRVDGLDGNDRIASGSGEVFGGAGNDFISTGGNPNVEGNANTYIDGGADNDLIFAGIGSDIIKGGDGSDLIMSSGFQGHNISHPTNGEVDKPIGWKEGDPLFRHQDINDFNKEFDLTFYFKPKYDDETNSYAYFYGSGDQIRPTISLPYTFGLTYNDPSKTTATEKELIQDLNETLEGRLTGIPGSDLVHGGTGDDFIVGSSDGDELYGEADNDYILGLNGDDKIYGGTNNDTKLKQGEYGDNLFGGAGRDFVDGGQGKDKVVGGYGDDVLYGGEGDDYIEGDVQNLIGTDAPPPLTDRTKFGADLIYGGKGEDTILANDGDDLVHGGDQNDIISGGLGNDFLYGDDGSDVIRGGEGDNDDKGTDADTPEDNDYIWGGQGKDFIYGEEGHDRLYGDGGVDYLYGGSGHDIIEGGSEDDFLYGQDDDDILKGDDGADNLFGGKGNDILIAGKGQDVLEGGDGADTYIFSLGDGKNTIKEELSDIRSENTSNIAQFTFGADKVTAVRRVDDGDLLIEFGTTDSVTVTGYYLANNSSNHDHAAGCSCCHCMASSENPVDVVTADDPYTNNMEIAQFQFADGTVWDKDVIFSKAPPPSEPFQEPESIGDVPYFIDALVMRQDIAVLGKQTITYGFLSDSTGELKDNKAYTAEQREAVKTALDKFAAVLDVTFVEDYSQSPDFKFYMDDLSSAGLGAYAGYASAQSGEIHINSSFYETGKLQPGEYGFEVLLHELGHAMGLKHPFEAPVLPRSENNEDNSIMSYTSNNENDTDLKMFDIAALQFLYGVNQTLAAGDDTYSFDNKYINDGAGTDTFDASAETESVYLDINQGGWSYKTEQKNESILSEGQSFVGFGTKIEKATGGNGNDTLVSNELDNTLTGGTGQDTYVFKTGDGIDTIIDADTDSKIVLQDINIRQIYNYQGKVFYSLADGILVDISTVDSWEVNGQLYSSSDFQALVKQLLEVQGDTVLTESQTNVILVDEADSDITGNGQDNIIIGNDKNNVLDGGTGIDQLAGGAGDDTYVVDHIEDTVVEKTNEGVDTVIASVDYTLTANTENLSIQGDALTATGNALNNTITGNEKDNVIDGKAGADKLIGGLGNDTYYVDNEKDQVIENNDSGTDTVYSTLLNNTLADHLENLNLLNDAVYANGNSLDNYIIGNDKDNFIIGNGGNDQLEGGLGNDTYIFGENNGQDVIVDIGGTTIFEMRNIDKSKLLLTNDNRLYYSDSQTSYINFVDVTGEISWLINGNTYTTEDLRAQHGVDAVSDTDIIMEAGQQNAALVGYNDISITGNELDNTLYGNVSNNTLDGGAGADTLVGGAGDDTYVVDNASDMVVEASGEGTDTVQASIDHTLADQVENLTLTGSAVAGTGNTLDNTITGNGLDNTLDGGAGADTLVGGQGDDTYVLDNINDTVIEQTDHGIDTAKVTFEGYTLTNHIENLILLDNVKKATGNKSDNTIIGNTEDNELNGGGGRDTFVFEKGGGRDVILGELSSSESQTDSIVLKDIVQSDVSVHLEGKDLVIDYATNDSIRILNYIDHPSIYEVVFSDGKWNVQQLESQLVYEVTGTDGYNLINTTEYSINVKVVALDGDDRIYTGSGDDIIYGGDGNDVIKSSSGNNAIYAGAGDDTIQSYSNDTIDAGIDNDTIHIFHGAILSEISGGAGNDTIIAEQTHTSQHQLDLGGEGDDEITVHGTDLGFVVKDGTDTFNLDIKNELDANIHYDADGGKISIRLSQFDLYKLNRDSISPYFDLSNIELLREGQGSFNHRIYNSPSKESEFIYANNKLTLFLGNNSNESAKRELFSIAVDDINTFDFQNFNILFKEEQLYTNTIGSNSSELTASYSESTIGLQDFVGQFVFKIYFDDEINTIKDVATYHNETIYANGGDDDINVTSASVLAGSGNDEVRVSYGGYHLGTDILKFVNGGDGNDIVIGGASQSLHGDSGDDIIWSKHGSTQEYQDAIYYIDDENDTKVQNEIFGGLGDDVLIGGALNDYIQGDEGKDILSGGAGDDIYHADTQDIIFESLKGLQGGYDTIHIDASYDLAQSNIEAVKLLGTASHNAYGNEFDNQLTGNDGDNILDGRTGADIMAGGAGNDYYVVDNVNDQVSDTSGIDTIERSFTSNYSLQNDIENLVLSGGATIAYGNAKDNVITLNAQNNTVQSYSGNDTIIYKKGGGKDSVFAEDVVTAADTLKLEGYNASDLMITQATRKWNGQPRSSLIINFKDSADQIELVGYFDVVTQTDASAPAIDNKIDKLVFDDGTEWTQSQIEAAVGQGGEPTDTNNTAPSFDNYQLYQLKQSGIAATKHAAINYQFSDTLITDADEGDVVTYEVLLAEPTTTPNIFYQKPLPSWLSFDPATRKLSGVPLAEHVGTIKLWIIGTDNRGGIDYDVISLTISDSDLPLNLAPQVAKLSDHVVTEDVEFTLDLSNSFNDPEGQAVSYSVMLADGSELPSDLSFDTTTNVLSGNISSGSATIELKITATDESGLSTTQVFALTTKNNEAPILTKALNDAEVTEAVAFSHTVDVSGFSDPEGGVLTYSVSLVDGTVLPDWLSFDAATHTLSGVAPVGSPAVMVVKLTATDIAGLGHDALFVIDIANNQAPQQVNDLADTSVTETQLLDYQLDMASFTDPEGTSIVYSATLIDGTTLPDWLSFDTETGKLTGSPPIGTQTLDIRISATDASGISSYDVITISVLPLDSPPELVKPFDTKPTEGYGFSYDLNDYIKDAQGDTISFTVTQSDGSALPEWLSFDAATAKISSTPPANVANISLVITATDSSGKTLTETLTLDPATNLAPVIDKDTADMSVTEGYAFDKVIDLSNITDPESGSLTYTMTLSDGAALPSWLGFTLINDTTAKLTGVTPAGTLVLNLTLTVTDEAGLSTSDDIVFTVAENQAPTLSTPLADQSVTEAVSFSQPIDLSGFADPEGTDLTFTVTQEDGSALPNWMTYDAATQILSGIAPVNTADINIKVTTTDGAGISTSDVFLLATGANQAPTLVKAIADTAVIEAVAFEYQVDLASFTDPEGTNITYSATLADDSTLPSWLSFDATTGKFSGTAPLNTADIDVKVIATDAAGISSSDVFTMTTSANQAPTLSTPLEDQSVTEAVSFSQSIDLSGFADPEGTSLTFTITQEDGSALPNWMTYDAATQTLSGNAPVNTTDTNIKVTATDGAGISTSDVFVLTTAANQAPELSSGFGDIDVVEEASFSQTLDLSKFSDPEGRSLTYTLTLADDSPLPEWLTFNTATQTLSGVPTVGGTSIKLKLTAADDVGNMTSTEFSLVVAANSVIKGTDVDDVITGTLGDDEIHALNGNDTVSADAGNDTILGGEGNDTLSGGAGNDYLEGGAGNDTYTVSKNDDNTIINNFDTDGSTDTLNLVDVSTGDISAIRSGDDLALTVKSTGANITVQNYFVGDGNGGYAVDTIQFTNTQASINTVKSYLLRGTANDDTIQGYATNDTINGQGGNDTIIGNAGDDTLSGGTGNDYLEGGAGNDTYTVSKNDDNTIINNFDTDGSTDTLNLVDVSTGDISAIRSGDDLALTVKSTGANITVQNYFVGDGNGGYAVDTIQFTNTQASINTVKSYLLGGTANDDTIQGYATNDSINGQGGNDTIIGNAGNDTLTGGSGNDTFVFNSPLGTDTITDFGIGDVIQLDNSVLTQLTDGQLDTANFASNATGAAQDANDYVVYNTSTGQLSYDADGNGSGAAKVFATLTGAPTLTVDDITVI